MSDDQSPQDDLQNNRNAAKDPDDWKTGDEPATAAQLSYIQTMATEAQRDVPENLTKADAAKLIEELQQQTGRGQQE